MFGFLVCLLIFFSAWTLSVQIVALLGGSLISLLLLFPVLIFVVGSIYFILRRFSPQANVPLPVCSRAEEIRNEAIWGRAVIAFLVPVSLYFSWAVFWTFGVFVLLYCLVLRRVSVAQGDSEHQVVIRFPHLIVGFFGVVAVLLTLGVLRPDLDDAYYAAVAAFVAGHPHAPVLAGDPMLGEHGLPLIFPSYRFSSFEVLPGAISYLFGIDSMDAYYILLPPVWAIASVIVIFLLARELMPRRWLLLGGLSFALLLLLGEMHRSPANFSFVRIFQGKAVFLSVIVPAIYLLVSRYFRCGSWTELFLLICCQITSIGLSNFGMLAGPMVLAGAMVSNLPLVLRLERKRLLLVGMVLLIPLPYLLSVLFGADSAGAIMQSPPEHAAQVWVSVFGGVQQYLVALLLIAGPLLAKDRITRWRLGGPVLLLLLVYLNPLLSNFISMHVTTPPVYWRVVWSLPVMIFCGASLCVIIDRLQDGRSARFAMSMILLMTAILTLYALPLNVLRSSNVGLTWSFATRKIPFEHYSVAQSAVKLETGRLLAPEEISGVISRFEQHPPLIVSRRMYLEFMAAGFSKEDYTRRVLLYNFVTGDTQVSETSVREALSALDVRTVVFADIQLSESAKKLLEAEGYRLVSSEFSYSIYSKAS